MLGPLIDPFREPTGWHALIEVVLLGTAGGALGCWVVLYRLSYAAESLAHGLLPGLVLAALLGLPLIAGGAAGLVVAGLGIALGGRIAELERDTAIGVVITALLGLGALLALSPQTPAGLQSLLFGDVLGVTEGDLVVAAVLAFAVIGSLAVLQPRLLAVGFDRGYAASTATPVLAIDITLIGLIAVTLLVAVQSLGNLLVVAVLIAPAAAARLVARRAATMMVVAALVAVSAGAAGLIASYHLHTATGATIALSFIAAYLLFAGARRRLV